MFNLVELPTINIVSCLVDIISWCVLSRPEFIDAYLDGEGIRSVQIVLQGGPNTIKTVYEAVSADPPIPVVLIKVYILFLNYQICRQTLF